MPSCSVEGKILYQIIGYMERAIGGEPSCDDLKLREIANFYLEVESNTEPLTQLVRFNPRCKKVQLGTKISTDIRTFFLLIVQFSYLLFTCHLKKINLFVGSTFYARVPRRTESIPAQEVYIQFLLDQEFNRMAQPQQDAISKSFRWIELTKSDRVFGDIVCEFIAKISNLIKGSLEKLKSSPQEGMLYRQMSGLRDIIDKYVLPQCNSLSPQMLMLCLEESELFREHSLLLKAFNNSLFVSVRYFHRSRGIFRDLVAMEEEYVLNRHAKSNFLEYIEKVELLIDDGLKLLLTHNLVSMEHSLEELQNTKDSSKKYALGSLKGNSVQSRKYSANIFIKERPLKTFDSESLQRIRAAAEQLQFQPQKEEDVEIGKGSFQGLKEKEKSQRNECVVEFHGSKNMLCVKYITGIELNLQNTDLLMFHCNSMSYGWRSLSLQFYEKNISKNKKKQKYLAFKTSSYVNQQERIIFKILTMVDLLIVYAKVVEPFLKKKLISSLEEYDLQNSDVNGKCEHLKNLFVQKIEESYLYLQTAQL